MGRPDELIAQHGHCTCPYHSPPPHCVCGDNWPCVKGQLSDYIRLMEAQITEQLRRKTMAGKDALLAHCADALNRIDDAKAAIGAEVDRKRITVDALRAVEVIRSSTYTLEDNLKHIEQGGGD